jgi:hypothetical protein
MKDLSFLALGFGLALVAYMLFKPSSKEGFVPEFLDQGNVKRTAMTTDSSYAQQTNHFVMTPSPPEQIPGLMTPFRVNIWNSVVPV